MSEADHDPRADDLELEARLREMVRVDPHEIEQMFSEIPAFIASASERSARATEAYLRAKAAVKRLRALHWLEAKNDLKDAGERPTEKMIDATVDADIDKRLQPYLEAEIEAEVEAIRAKGILVALQAKKDALVSIGANLRAELERDPIIRSRLQGGRIRSDREAEGG